MTTSAETSHFHRQLAAFIEQQIRPQLITSDHFRYEIAPLTYQPERLQCASDISFEPARALTAGNFSIKASCPDPQPWSLYVRGEIMIDRVIVVAAQALPKNTPISADNVRLMSVPLESLRSGYFTSFEEVANYTLKQAISKDTPLNPRLLNPPLLVRKNDQVIIVAGEPNRVEVRVAGVALQDGKLHQQIRVRNLSSGRQIKARVTGRGLVRAEY